jgi:hypothetical protein
MTTKTRFNKEWHLMHKMPKNPTTEQRIEWHIEHARYCDCREIPPKLKAKIEKMKNRIK